jgi:hypothetical protein
MNNRKIASTLYHIGEISLIVFPVFLIIAFAVHFMGEFGFADFLKLRLIYEQPRPERFMELFRSSSLMDFVLPHLIIYLALPLLVPAVIFLAAFLFERKPWLSIVGILTTLAGTIYMGGVFGSWLSFTAIGAVNADQVAGSIPALAALIKNQGMLRMTSALAGLSILGILIIAAGLFFTRVVPRWQVILIFVGNLMIIAFMDIDNLMLLGATLWFIGALPFWNRRPDYRACL